MKEVERGAPDAIRLAISKPEYTRLRVLQKACRCKSYEELFLRGVNLLELLTESEKARMNFFRISEATRIGNPFHTIDERFKHEDSSSALKTQLQFLTDTNDIRRIHAIEKRFRIENHEELLEKIMHSFEILLVAKQKRVSTVVVDDDLKYDLYGLATNGRFQFSVRSKIQDAASRFAKRIGFLS